MSSKKQQTKRTLRPQQQTGDQDVSNAFYSSVGMPTNVAPDPSKLHPPYYTPETSDFYDLVSEYQEAYPDATEEQLNRLRCSCLYGGVQAEARGYVEPDDQRFWSLLRKSCPGECWGDVHHATRRMIPRRLGITHLVHMELPSGSTTVVVEGTAYDTMLGLKYPKEGTAKVVSLSLYNPYNSARDLVMKEMMLASKPPAVSSLAETWCSNIWSERTFRDFRKAIQAAVRQPHPTEVATILKEWSRATDGKGLLTAEEAVDRLPCDVTRLGFAQRFSKKQDRIDSVRQTFMGDAGLFSSGEKCTPYCGNIMLYNGPEDKSVMVSISTSFDFVHRKRLYESPHHKLGMFRGSLALLLEQTTGLLAAVRGGHLDVSDWGRYTLIDSHPMWFNALGDFVRMQPTTILWTNPFVFGLFVVGCLARIIGSKDTTHIIPLCWGGQFAGGSLEHPCYSYEDKKRIYKEAKKQALKSRKKDPLKQFLLPPREEIAHQLTSAYLGQSLAPKVEKTLLVLALGSLGAADVLNVESQNGSLFPDEALVLTCRITKN